MRHEDRRKELGKMLMDISKYLATAGLASGLIAGSLPLKVGLVVIVVVLILAIIGFFVVPPKKGG